MVSPTSAFAVGCNLYTTSSTCLSATFAEGVGDAQYYVTDPQPTGTGVIDSFLRLQMKGEEQGFNSDARPVQFDEKTDPNYTRDLLVSEIPLIDGYRQFFLDINEQSADPGGLITLDQLEIYVHNTNDITGYSSAGTGSLGTAVKKYDLDNGGTDNYVNLDYTLISGGSGKGDMVVYIKDDGTWSNFTYVTLFSQFGCSPTTKGGKECKDASDDDKWPSGAGFEEWWVRDPTPNIPVPEPSSLLLLGAGALVAIRKCRPQPKA
jgi:hypothetical protein